MREHFFTVPKSEFLFKYSRGTGKGGQKRNKTETKVQCNHIESGAYGVDDSTRSQHKNKEIAFRKCVDTPQFQVWLRRKINQKLGLEHEIKERVDAMMKREEDFLVEYF
jgi:protein subunit release factor A